MTTPMYLVSLDIAPKGTSTGWVRDLHRSSKGAVLFLDTTPDRAQATLLTEVEVLEIARVCWKAPIWVQDAQRNVEIDLLRRVKDAQQTAARRRCN